jgi:hypothetical protein
LFSTSSQPAWKDARWLGGYLTNSAFLLGCAVLLALAILSGQERATALLRLSLVPLLLLNLAVAGLLAADLRASADGRFFLALAAGTLLPLGLLPVAALAAIGLILAGSVAVRVLIVGLPGGARAARG